MKILFGIPANIRDGIDHLSFALNYKAVIESMCIN